MKKRNSSDGTVTMLMIAFGLSNAIALMVKPSHSTYFIESFGANHPEVYMMDSTDKHKTDTLMIYRGVDATYYFRRDSMITVPDTAWYERIF